MTSGEATGGALPPALYSGPEAFQRERRTVFQNAWLLLARTDVLRMPGAYVAQSLGGWPVFAIADAGGAPGVFRSAGGEPAPAVACRGAAIARARRAAARPLGIRRRLHPCHVERSDLDLLVRFVPPILVVVVGIHERDGQAAHVAVTGADVGPIPELEHDLLGVG